jgi:hypothetical protein
LPASPGDAAHDVAHIRAMTTSTSPDRWRRALLAVAMCAWAACGTSYEVADQPLAGTIDGEPWTFVAGATDAFLSEGEDEFFAGLYDEAFEPCQYSEPDRPTFLIASIPKQPGEYEFSLSLNMTFVVDRDDGPDNLVATDGVIVVDEVTATTVRGGLHGVFDDDNEVNGTFEVAICAATED